MKRTLAVTTTVLALLGIGASLEHLIGGDHANAAFYENPRTMALHVILGAAYLGLALPQFLSGLRSSRPTLHRVMGRLAVVSGLVAGVTALVIAFAFPYSGAIETAIVAPFAGLFTVSLLRGIWLARRRRFAEHREWMIRALAVGTSIATMRLIFVPALLGLGEPTVERAVFLSWVSFLIAFALHFSIAEIWIRTARAPAAKRASGPGLEHESELVRT